MSIPLTSSSNNETVAVVVLNWNGGDDILRCLQSVFASSHRHIEVIVVDNGSSDGSSEAIRSLFPAVVHITNPENLGFAKGSNQGMEYALERGHRYIMLLNGDARVDSEMVARLLIAATREGDTAIACPKMYASCECPSRDRLWFTCGTVRLWAGFFHNPAHGQIDSPAWSSPRDMEYASGCCMLIPRRILEQAGMLDESFFAYCEDIDFSLRARRAGFRLCYVPSALLWHGSAAPSGRTGTPRYRYLSTRNNLWTVRKHGTKPEIASCISLLVPRSLFRIAKAVAKGRADIVWAELQGVRHGLFAPVSK